LTDGEIFTIDPTTGNQVGRISDTGLDFIGDLDLRPVPEPSTFMLLAVGVAALLSRCDLSSLRR